MICTSARTTVASWLESPHRAPWEAPTFSTRDLEEGLSEIRELGTSDPARAHKLARALTRTLPMLCDANPDVGRLEHFCRAVARTTMQLAEATGLAPEDTERLLLETFAAHGAPALQGVVAVLETPPLALDGRLRVARLARQVAGGDGARSESLLAMAERLET